MSVVGIYNFISLNPISREKYVAFSHSRSYELYLKHLLDKFPRDVNPQLQSKYLELHQLIASNQLILPEDSKLSTDLTFECFTQINNNLRPIADLIELNIITPHFEQWRRQSQRLTSLVTF